MERIGVRDLNQNTSQVLARVSSGETIEITDRGRPVARLVPLDDVSTALDRLVLSGRATGPSSSGPVPVPPELGDPAVSAADELIELRDEERW